MSKDVLKNLIVLMILVAMAMFFFFIIGYLMGQESVQQDSLPKPMETMSPKEIDRSVT